MRFQVATRISFCRREISSCCLAAAAAATAAAAGLALREVAVERLHLDEEQIGLHLAAAILGHGVVRDDVAGLERPHLRRRRVGRGAPARPRAARLVLAGRLVDARQARPNAQLLDAALERLEASVRGCSSSDACAGARTACVISSRKSTCWPTTAVAVDVDRRGLPFAAVDRVAHLDAIEAEVVVRLDAHRDFFDVARAPVAAGLHDLDDGLVVGNDLDQIVVRDASRNRR